MVAPPAAANESRTIPAARAVGRVIEDRPDRIAQFGGAQLIDAQSYAGPASATCLAMIGWSSRIGVRTSGRP